MKKIRGFTLIEMIITIVVIIILSSISVPMYKGYKRQAILAEGYVLIGAIKTAQLAYYNRYRYFFRTRGQEHLGSYGTTSYDPVTGVDARGNKYFTWFRPGAIDFFKCSFGAMVFKPQELRPGGGDSVIGLQYNISLGQKYYEGAEGDADYSWWE